MRNLKKFLALVLTLMMVMSLFVTVSASHVKPGTRYSDDASIINYDEAVQVLTQLGVYKGRNTKTNFAPEGTITRMEVATLLYRIATGDVNETSNLLNTDLKPFNDVEKDHWAAGQITYAYINRYVYGVGGGNYMPDRKVTGYEVLAMILRAIGYDHNGEFRGANWKFYTSGTAWNLGITTGISDEVLERPASRGLVAELLFRTIAKTSKVDWNIIKQDYDKVDGIGGASKGGMTLAWDVFGLYGGANNVGTAFSASTDPINVNFNGGTITAADQFLAMSNREKAKVDGEYDAPLAKWYVDSNKNGTANYDINVKFNPVKTYTEAVSPATIMADSRLAAGAVDHYNVDGVKGSLTLSATDTAAIADTGRGTEVAVYSVAQPDGTTESFVTVAKTYVARTASEVADSQMHLVNDAGTAITPGTYSANTATGYTVGTVVIFHEYANDAWGTESNTTIDRVDRDTVKAASYYPVVVTYTYDNNVVKDSWFTASGTNYYYNANYDGSVSVAATNPASGNHLGQVVLNRGMDQSEATKGTSYDSATGNVTDFVKNQTIYFDETGKYVIYTENGSKDVRGEGWVTLTDVSSQAYRDAVNGYYIQVTGYNEDNTAFSGKGAIDKTLNANGIGSDYTYGSSDDATKGLNNWDLGIYHYFYDKDTGYYSFTPLADMSWGNFGGTTAPGTYTAPGGVTPILRGKADAIASGNNGLLSNNTSFVIANHNDKGFIQSFSAPVGFKNIKDLKDAQKKNAEGETWTATKNVDYVTQWVDTDKDGEIDMVFVVGAKQEDDIYNEPAAATKFYLLDPYSTSQVAEYDLHKVVIDGVVLDQQFTKYFVHNGTPTASADYNNGYTSLGITLNAYDTSAYWTTYANGAMWTAHTWADNNKTRISSVVENAGTTPVASCYYAVSGVINYGGTYVTLSDNCRIYEINKTAMTSKLITPSATTIPAGSDLLVVSYDGYGFATLIYKIV